ncbi:alanine racemase [Pseudolysinimonas sp.]|uniref:alanine racemase n=1 Tax=Pseudolysinimonas sp. TaxID=2680009 RepID=UPI00286BEEFE|nr:alanine racemase [Pseudolysinimonas sp.]
MLREARIDLGAMQANLDVLRATVAPAKVMGVVKAQAYGHGAVGIARALADHNVDWLGVTDLAEALELRAAGITTPVLSWLHGPDLDATAAVEHDIDLGVSTIDQLERAAAAGATVQLKIDTGLSRNGFPPTDAITAFARAADHERRGQLRVRGIFSHLSNSSPADDDRQLELFVELVDAARDAGLDPELQHLASTQAALTRPDTRLDLVRLGIGLYGVEYGDDADPAALGLRPVMELAGTVAAVRRVPAGTGMSYGFIDRTSRETTLALVPLGYADGVPRAASGSATVAINGTTYRQVGRIAMDQFLVDVGDDAVAVGDRVVLWGDPATGAPSASDWARAAGTIGYEIVTRVGSRVPRVFVDGAAAR